VLERDMRQTQRSRPHSRFIRAGQRSRLPTTNNAVATRDGQGGVVMAKAVWACLVACVLASSSLRAETFPDRPIKLLVPLAAASAVDVVARLVGDKMGEILGQRLFVENQPGAAGLIGMRTGARAAPDGYTVIVANDSVLTMVPNLKSDAGYDPLTDFVPVTQLAGIPLGLIVNPAFP